MSFDNKCRCGKPYDRSKECGEEGNWYTEYVERESSCGIDTSFHAYVTACCKDRIWGNPEDD